MLVQVGVDKLAALIADRDAQGEARFLATELWFDGHSEPPAADLAELGEIRARAGRELDRVRQSVGDCRARSGRLAAT